jgi:hypothetical protein
LDTCLSCFFTNFSGAHEYAYDLHDLGTYYGLYKDLMGYWRSTLRIPMLDVRYEDMVANQEETSRRLVEFCGLEWEPNCLAFYETNRGIATASFDQVRQPIYRTSVGRWKNYAAHIGPLRQALGLASEHEEGK